MSTEKTFIVLGVPRGGTSMMAGFLRILGIDMGDRIKPDKHEDLDILWKDQNNLVKKIKEYNSRKKIWGFKEPNMATTIYRIKNFFINPHYIIIKRNPEESIKSDLRRNKNTTRQFVENRNLLLRQSIEKIKYTTNNYIELAYEDFIYNPGPNLKKLMQFVGVDDDGLKQKCLDFIKPGEYVAIDQ